MSRERKAKEKLKIKVRKIRKVVRMITAFREKLVNQKVPKIYLIQWKGLNLEVGTN